MTRLSWVLFLSASLCSFSANAGRIQTIPVDTSRLNAAPTLPLKCAFRLDNVTDERPAGDQAGALGKNIYVLDNAPAMLREQFLAGGLIEEATDENALEVNVKLMRLYITQNLYTRVPVVVYMVSVDRGDPFVVRSQVAAMSWSASEEKAYESYAAALRDANNRLFFALNRLCP